MNGESKSINRCNSRLNNKSTRTWHCLVTNQPKQTCMNANIYLLLHVAWSWLSSCWFPSYSCKIKRAGNRIRLTSHQPVRLHGQAHLKWCTFTFSKSKRSLYVGRNIVLIRKNLYFLNRTFVLTLSPNIDHHRMQAVKHY